MNASSDMSIRFEAPSPVFQNCQDFGPLQSHSLFLFLAELARGFECELYLVGGAVRQWVMSESLAEDLDFAIVSPELASAAGRGLAAEFAQTFAGATGGRVVPLDEVAGIYRVVLRVQEAAVTDPEAASQVTFDFSDALNQSLDDDLARRDLTVNALAWDVLENQLIDHYDGLKDLQAGRIRMVRAENFEDDPLRVLRVFRFAAQLQAKEVDGATQKALLNALPGLSRVAGERIQVEFMKMLDAPRCFPYLEWMGACGVLETLLPELRDTRQVGPNEHHHLWLFDHTLELVNQFELQWPTLPEAVQQHISRPMQAGCSRGAFLKLACLLHDIGKPATMVTYEDDPEAKRSVTFYGHDAVSETMSEAIVARLKLSTEAGDYVKKLVRWHLYPAQFDLKTALRRSVLKLFRRMGEATWDVLALSLADRLSTLGPAITPEAVSASVENHLGLMQAYGEELENLKQPPLLNGNEVMAAFDLKPGPHLKVALNLLVEAQQLGEVSNQDEALTWLRANQAQWIPAQKS